MISLANLVNEFLQTLYVHYQLTRENMNLAKHNVRAFDK